jgi:tetratricopeptide (TPR) repeat protein
MEELLGHLHPLIIPERVNAIDPYIDKRWDCLNRSGGCYSSRRTTNEGLMTQSTEQFDSDSRKDKSLALRIVRLTSSLVCCWGLVVVWGSGLAVLAQETEEETVPAAEVESTVEDAPNDAVRTEELFRSGVDKARRQDYQGAIADFSEVLELNPQYIPAYYNRGLARSFIGQVEEAIADYTQALEFFPEDIEAYNNRGILRSQLGDFEGAIDDYTEALDRNPNKVNAYYNRALAQVAVGDFPAARSDYDQAILLDPNYVDAYNNRGILRSQLGDFEGAIDDYTQAIRRQPTLAEAYYNRGTASAAAGKRETALKDFQVAAQFFLEANNTEQYQIVLEAIDRL